MPKGAVLTEVILHACTGNLVVVELESDVFFEALTSRINTLQETSISHLTGKGKSSTHSAFKWDMLVFLQGRHLKKGPLFHCFDTSDQAVLKNIGPTK